MAVERGRPTLIRSVQRALRLIEIVGECEGRATAKEIARATGLPLATAYHILRTCTYEGWLQRLGDGTYVLGHRLDTVHLEVVPGLVEIEVAVPRLSPAVR